MEIIVDELRKNNVNIDVTTLSHYINYILDDSSHDKLYDEMANCLSPKELLDVFYEMNVNSFGRTMAYLTLVYLTNAPEDDTREAVRLVAAPLKDMNFTAFKAKESFFQRMLSGIRRMFAL